MKIVEEQLKATALVELPRAPKDDATLRTLDFLALVMREVVERDGETRTLSSATSRIEAVASIAELAASERYDGER